MPYIFSRICSARRRVGSFAVVLLCLLAASACAERPPLSAKTPSGQTLPRTQLPMPPTTTDAQNTAAGSPDAFTLMDNRRMRLSDYAGQVVVLDFYATWCQPCREETPHLVRLHQRYNAAGLRIIGLNVGGDEDRARIADFTKEYQISYALGFPDREMSGLYLSDDNRIPQAFVFDRKGNLVKRFVNYDSTTPAELESVIKTQLAAE